MRLGRYSRLPQRLALITVSIAVAVALVFSALEAALFYKEERAAQRENIERILDLETEPASLALYEMDSGLAQKILTGLTNFPYIAAATITDDNGIQLAQATASPQGSPSTIIAAPLSGEEEVLERPLRIANWDGPLGKLTVTLDNQALLKELGEKTLARILSISTQFVIVAALLGIVVHISVIRPLLRMMEEFSNVELDGTPSPPLAPPKSLRNTEVALLSDAINGIIQRAREEIGRRIRYGEALHRNEERLINAQQVAHMGSFEHDLASGACYWSDELFRLLGHDPKSVTPSHDALLLALSPDSRELLADQLQSSHPLTRDHLNLEVVYTPKDGAVRHGQISAAIERDGDGDAVAIRGAFLDVTERKRIEIALRKSEERYALVTKGANDGIWDWDVSTETVYFSSRWKGILGYEDDELENDFSTWVSLLHPDDRESAVTIASQTAAGERDNFEMVFRMLHRDGSICWIMGRGASLKDESGNVIRIAGTHTDVTAMKETELALKNAEEKYRAIFSNAPIGIFRSTVDGRLLEANLSMARMFGFESREMLLQRVQWVEKDLFRNEQTNEGLLDNVPYFGAHHAEVTLKRITGETFHASIRVNLVRSAEGGEDILDGTIEDITERRNAQEAIRQSKERYRRLFTEMQEGFALHKALFDDTGQPLDYEFIEINPAFQDLTGLSAQNVVGNTVLQLLPDTDPQWIKACCEVAVGAPPFSAVNTSNDLGRTFQVRIYSPEEGYFAATFNDITQEREAEELLRRSEEKYREIFNATTDAIVLMDPETLDILDVNKSFCDMYGLTLEEAVGTSSFAMSALPQDVTRQRIAPLHKQVMQGKAVNFEWRSKRATGETFWTDNISRLVKFGGADRVLLVIRDISERRAMQEMMVQTEKMMSVGGLAAGMAHEINNPLGIITLMVQNLERRFSPDMPSNRKAAKATGVDLKEMAEYIKARNIDSYVKSIREAADRAAVIVRSMLDFSRKPKTEMVPCAMHELFENVIELAASDYDLKKNYDFKKIRITRDYDPTLPLLMCAPSEISQVLLNILKNAAQALGMNPDQKEPPAITVRTAQEPGRIVLEITDNGPGMDEATRRRIFEPFYTTKAPGIGTGLGMSVSYFIITSKYRGNISVDSLPSKGTKFIIKLPLDAFPEYEHHQPEDTEQS